MKFILKPLPHWVKVVFLFTWMTTLYVPWCLRFSWWLKLLLFIAVFLYGAFIGLRDVWRCLPYSIAAIERSGNGQWQIQFRNGVACLVRIAEDSVVSATVIFLRLIAELRLPFYFPKTILLFSADNREAYRLCLLALREGDEREYR